MNQFTQHIPSFVDRRDPAPTTEFSTTEELLSLDVVQRYKGPKFSHFALEGNCLMAISDEGFQWWVAGYIKDPSTVELPQWNGWKHRAELPDGSRVILSGDDVVSSCGDELTLRNGTKARNLRNSEPSL